MRQQKTFSTNRLASGVLLGAVASGVAAAALGTAGTANAACASISGLGNTANCQSTPTSFAINLGDNTNFAQAKGLFTGAIVTNGTNNIASSTGAFSAAIVGGTNSAAATNGNLALAFAQGTRVLAAAGGTAGDVGNVAINIGNSAGGLGTNNAIAAGFFNIAANVGGNAVTKASQVQAIGLGNAAFNFASDDFKVVAGTAGTPATLSSAFNFFGKGNTVTAGPGPLAIAGAINLVNKTVTQTGPGININNL